MKPFLIVALVVLAVLHQDFWWWDDATPVFGFVPIGLAWHIGVSVAAGVLWWLAVRFAWPAGLDDPASPEEEAGR